jgi:zinc protease
VKYTFLPAKLTVIGAAAALSICEAAAQTLSQPSAAARAAWGFDRSDLAPHPGVRFGVLGNGMRYAVMRNAATAGGLSVRFRFDVGARVEGPRERGFVHLIEHLVFHGTPNIPEGSFALMLAHRGLRRWTDFDAFTSFDETVYRLDMAKSDLPARDVSLMLMREIASNLLFTRRMVEGAKQKVREEIAARDAVQDSIMAAQNAFFLPGTPLARGPVAGTQRQVGRATAAALRRLYDLHYVPRRATLVMVGDFDPERVEAEIAARFSDWARRGGAPPDIPTPGISVRSNTEARLFVHPQAPTTVTIASVIPLSGTADEGRARDASFLEQLGAEILNRRLARMAAGPDAPFAAGTVSLYDRFSTARVAELQLGAKDRDWLRALTTGAVELRRAVEGGFTQGELDSQLAVSRAALARASAPRTTPALADAIVDAASRSIVFTVPGDPAATDAYLAQIRLTAVNTAFAAAWARPERLIFVSNNRRISGGEAAVAEAWRSQIPY